MQILSSRDSLRSSIHNFGENVNELKYSVITVYRFNYLHYVLVQYKRSSLHHQSPALNYDSLLSNYYFKPNSRKWGGSF